eukprot:g10949.t2
MDQVRATEGDLQVYRRAFAAADQGRELWQMWRNMVFAKKHWGGTSWPGWKFNRGTLVATPSVAVLSTIYSTGHDEETDHMRRAIQSECDGEFLNVDGTWRIASRVVGMPDCLFFLLGEDAKVHDYGAVTGEHKNFLRPLYERYADRRKRNGTLPTLQHLYDDNCCRGALDATEAWIKDIFVGLTRTALADSFHFGQTLVGATTSKTHPRRAVFAAGVGNILRQRYQPDVDEVAAYLQRVNPGLSKADAEARAKKRAWSPFVRTTSRPADLVEGELVKFVEAHARLDEVDVARKGIPLLRPDAPPGKTGPTGAMAALRKMRSCLRKGCAQDPLGVDDMYIPLGRGPKTQLMRWSKKGGTGRTRTSTAASTVWWKAWLVSRSANEAARELLAALPFPKAPPDPEISTEELEPMGFEFHAAMKVAALEEARNAAARMVAERRGNNPHSSPSTTAGGATGAGASLLPTAGGRASAAAGTGPGPGALPPPTAGIRAGAAAAAAAAAGTGPGPGALPPPTAGTRAGAAAAAETGPGHH